MARLRESGIVRKLSALRRVTIRGLPQRDVVIYDSFSRRHLYPLLDMSMTVVFDLDFPKVNLWIALRSLAFGKPSSRTYLLAFLKQTRPKVVISTSDNSLDLYSIKSHFPDICVIAIQNGRRNTFGPRPHSSFQSALASSSTRPAIDYYFTFGSTERVQFEPLVNAKFVAHGNLKNNYLAHISLESAGRERTLSYISSFPNLSSGAPSSIDSDLPTHFFGESPISFRSYFSPEGTVAHFLTEYCRDRGLKFQVIGKRSSSQPQERAYFQMATCDPNLKYVPCDPESASYRALIRSDYVVSIDSTLAYEMLGRGKRTAFLTMRASAIGIPDLRCPKFGFPEITEESGPFWTNFDNAEEFTRVLDFVIDASETQWNETTSSIIPKVMNLDPDNRQLFQLLGSLGVAHDGGIEEVRRRAKEVYGAE